MIIGTNWIRLLKLLLMVIGLFCTGNKQAMSVSIIGGADGPTSVFLAGELPEDLNETAEYHSISMDEATERFGEEGSILLDVRRIDEFSEGHVPGAVNLPNEEIGTERPELLTDLEQTIFVYCRSGKRSKEASEKLAALGYRNVIECGGIQDYTGETETGE